MTDHDHATAAVRFELAARTHRRNIAVLLSRGYSEADAVVQARNALAVHCEQSARAFMARVAELS
jgi:hypothetical protein